MDPNAETDTEGKVLRDLLKKPMLKFLRIFPGDELTGPKSQFTGMDERLGSQLPLVSTSAGRDQGSIAVRSVVAKITGGRRTIELRVCTGCELPLK